jgi:hypothetical protein
LPGKDCEGLVIKESEAECNIFVEEVANLKQRFRKTVSENGGTLLAFLQPIPCFNP